MAGGAHYTTIGSLVVITTALCQATFFAECPQLLDSDATIADNIRRLAAKLRIWVIERLHLRV
jgi:hypothetical protein